VLLFVCFCNCFLCGGAGVHGIWIIGRVASRVPRVSTVCVSAVLPSTALVSPLESRPGVAWSVAAVLDGGEISSRPLFLHPDMVVSLGRLGPFVEGIRVVHLEARVQEALGEALCELGHYRRLVKVVSSTACQLSEPGDIVVDIPILHFEFAQFLVGMLVFGIVNKRFLELLFNILPLVHPSWDFCYAPRLIFLARVPLVLIFRVICTTGPLLTAYRTIWT